MLHGLVFLVASCLINFYYFSIVSSHKLEFCASLSILKRPEMLH